MDRETGQAMSEGNEIRVALLGTGAIAQVVHLPILTQLPGVRVRAVCDADRSKAAAIASRFNVPEVFRKDEEVFKSDEIDAVLICTPSYLHAEQAIAALEGGKHVLVEKPLALSAEDAGRVLDTARKTGRLVSVAMNTRYRPDVQALRPFVRGGELGQPFLIKAGWLNRKVRVVRSTWRHKIETAGGGAFMDLGVQMLDLALWLLGFPRVRRIVAQMHKGERMEVEDTAVVLLEVEKGPVISIEVTWSLFAERDRHYLDVLGSKGSASLSPLAVHKEVEHGLLDVTPHLEPGRENPYTASYRGELVHFVEAIRGERPLEPPAEQVELMRLVALAYQSAREGREVEA